MPWWGEGSKEKEKDRGASNYGGGFLGKRKRRRTIGCAEKALGDGRKNNGEPKWGKEEGAEGRMFQGRLTGLGTHGIRGCASKRKVKKKLYQEEKKRKR